MFGGNGSKEDMVPPTNISIECMYERGRGLVAPVEVKNNPAMTL